MAITERFVVSISVAIKKNQYWFVIPNANSSVMIEVAITATSCWVTALHYGFQAWMFLNMIAHAQKALNKSVVEQHECYLIAMFHVMLLVAKKARIMRRKCWKDRNLD